jgi:hypothetical protein
MLRRIISGGQTGADRAGLDFAIHVGLEHGGYVPKGRKAEDGKIAERYNLVELSTTSYPARTKRNTEESDGTVIFSLERLLSGGTKLLWGLPTSLGSRCGGSRTHRATSSRTLAKRKLAPSSSSSAQDGLNTNLFGFCRTAPPERPTKNPTYRDPTKSHWKSNNNDTD